MKIRVLATALLAVTASVVPASADPPTPQAEAVLRATRAQVAASLAVMATAAGHARRVLQWARQGGTPAQITCANEGLSRADVAWRAAREYAVQADEAWARRDTPAARRALILFASCREASRLAASAADACLGEENDTIVRVSGAAPR